MSNLFAQIPAWAIYKPQLTDLQFRIYCLLELFRFTGEREVTSVKIATALKIHPDTARRNITLMMQDNIFKSDEITFHIVKQKSNQPDLIVVHFKYLQTEISLGHYDDVHNGDLDSIIKILKKSKHFSKYKASEIWKISGADSKDELIKGIFYTDSGKSIKNEAAYLRSLFSNGKFKYDFSFQDKIEMSESKTKIKDQLACIVEIDELEKLPTENEHYRFLFYKEKYHAVVYEVRYNTKPANIENALQLFNIKYSTAIYRHEQIF